MTQLDYSRLNPPCDRLVNTAFYQEEIYAPDSKNVLVRTIKGYLGILNLATSTVTRVFDRLSTNVTIWSPNSRMIAARGGSAGQSEFGSYLLNVNTGKTTDLGLQHMLPLAWLNEETVIWINRWSAKDLDHVGPLRLAITNVTTGKSRIVEIK